MMHGYGLTEPWSPFSPSYSKPVPSQSSIAHPAGDILA